MYETSLNKVLNYMKQYVENRFEHDSEPMLNYKDLELVINHINKQKEVLDKIKKYVENLLKEEFEITDPDNINYGEKCQRAYFSDSELGKILELLEEIE